MATDVYDRAARRKGSELMKSLSRLLLAPTVAAALLLPCNPTNAASRVGGSPYDETWSVAIYTQRGDCGSVREDRRWPRVFRGSKLSIEWSCRR
jgi:hypothetical protein